jgi:hypothetical protein
MLNKDYILGFVEGEGCFSITISRYVDRKSRKTIFKYKLHICDIRDSMNYRKTKFKWDKEEIAEVFDINPIHQTAHFDPSQTGFIHNNSFDQKAFLKKKQSNNMASKVILDQTELA